MEKRGWQVHKGAKVKARVIYVGVFLLLVLIEVYIALFVHDRFIRPYIGDVLVVMVLYFLVRIFLPKGGRWLPLCIFIFAVGVELLQYFNLVELLGLSGNRFMRTLLGSVFDIKDIICYGVGCILLQLGQWGAIRCMWKRRAERTTDMNDREKVK